MERAAKQLGAASQAKPPPSLVEALDDGRRHAQRKHEDIGAMGSARFDTDADPSALGLTQPPSQVADMTRARGPPDQLKVPRLQLID